MHSNCIFVITVILISFSVVLCAPTNKDSQEMIGPDVKQFYDQRQNGTENYRIDIKDFAIVITPLETLLNVATMLDPIFFEEFKRNDLRKEQTDVTNNNNTDSDLTTELTTTQEENKISSETKPKRGLKSRIGNLILPFMRRHH